MRKMICGAVFSALVLVPLGFTPAVGATASVKINKIGTKTAKYKGTYKVVPSVSVRGNVKVSKKSLTVKKGKKTIRKNVSAANLKAGKYKVTTTVKYRTFANRTKSRTVINTGSVITDYPSGGFPYSSVGECRIGGTQVVSEFSGTLDGTCDIEWVTADRNYNLGKMAVAGIYTSSESQYVVNLQDGQDNLNIRSLSPGTTFYPRKVKATKSFAIPVAYRAYSSTKTRSKTQWLTIKKGKKPRTCATKTEFNRIKVDGYDTLGEQGTTKATATKILHNAGKRSLYSEDAESVIEFRDYKACSKNAHISVGFFNNRAYDKTYYSF